MLFTAETMAYESILCCHKEGRQSRHLVIVIWLLILAGNLNLTKTGKKLVLAAWTFFTSFSYLRLKCAFVCVCVCVSLCVLMFVRVIS